MKHNVRLIMTDLDGTLLTDEKRVTDYTRQIIWKVRQKGILFGIATGRTLYAVETLIKKWNIENHIDVMIGMNGAQYFDQNGFREITDLLDGKYMVEIMERIQDSEVVFGIFENAEKAIYADRWSLDIQRVADNNQFELKIIDLKSWLHNRSYEKLILACPRSHMNVLKAYCADMDTENYRGFHTGGSLYEFMDPIVSKSYGIKKICNRHGFSMKEVMGFGDSSNDLEMIRDVGIGVCVANGTDDVKAIAKYTSESNNDDGLGKFVEAYFGL